MKTEFIFRVSAEHSINKVSNHVLVTYAGMFFNCTAFSMHHVESYPEEEITRSVDDIRFFISFEKIKNTYFERKTVRFTLQFTVINHLIELCSYFNCSHNIHITAEYMLPASMRTV